MAYTPDIIGDAELERSTIGVAHAVWELANDNPEPEGGTLGFIMGLALALGNVAAIYVSGADRRQRKDFEGVVLQMVRDAFREPIITGELTAESRMH